MILVAAPTVPVNLTAAFESPHQSCLPFSSRSSSVNTNMSRSRQENLSWVELYDGTTNNNGNVLTHSYAGSGLSYTQTFGYDELNRLSTSSEGGSSWSQNNLYDRYGNRATAGNLSFSDSTNRITTSGYSLMTPGISPTTAPKPLASTLRTRSRR